MQTHLACISFAYRSPRRHVTSFQTRRPKPNGSIKTRRNELLSFGCVKQSRRQCSRARMQTSSSASHTKTLQSRSPSAPTSRLRRSAQQGSARQKYGKRASNNSVAEWGAVAGRVERREQIKYRPTSSKMELHVGIPCCSKR
eukprot:6209527-Pleurochrysis_carterae.AAC.3